MKKVFKKITAAILLLTLSLTLFGCSQNQNTPAPPPDEPLYDGFYDQANWEIMTNNNGSSTDAGESAVSLSDGSIKFFRANQAYRMGDHSSEHLSFMLKATHNFDIWFMSTTKDNNVNQSVRLTKTDDRIFFALSTAPYQSIAEIGSTFVDGEYNQMDLFFKKTDNTLSVDMNVNEQKCEVTKGAIGSANVRSGGFDLELPSDFSLGEYVVVKVWYADDYVQFKPVAKKNDLDTLIVAAIGDSITEGAGATDFYADSYPNQMQTLLGGEYNVINFGMSGRTARVDLPSYDSNPIGWVKNRQFAGIAKLKPDIAFIKLGSNDSKTTYSPLTTKENFKAALSDIINKLYQVNPDMEIIVCTSAYAYSSAYDISNANIESIINPVQRELANENGLALIDLHEITKGKSKLFPDGIHPNTRGYAMIAEVLSKYLTEGQLTNNFLNSIDQKYND